MGAKVSELCVCVLVGGRGSRVHKVWTLASANSPQIVTVGPALPPVLWLPDPAQQKGAPPRYPHEKAGDL